MRMSLGPIMFRTCSDESVRRGDVVELMMSAQRHAAEVARYDGGMQKFLMYMM